MCNLIRGRVLLVGACMLVSVAAWAQQTKSVAKASPITTDFAVTYATERAELNPGQCCFWMSGASADAAVTFWKGFGIAGEITGGYAPNVAPQVDVNTISFLAGPRYTRSLALSHKSAMRVQLFGQGLFGGVHGFHGVYPAPGGVTDTANAFAIQAGGGINLYLTRVFGLRLAEADYVRTTLPNGGSNEQTDLRLSAGLTYHFGGEKYGK